MLLPMFHIFDMPIKPSYVILLVAPFISFGTASDGLTGRRTWSMTSPIIGLIFFSCLGQYYLTVLGDVIDPYSALKQIMIYVFMVLAFVLGQRAPHFPLRWVLWVLYLHIALLLSLSVFAEKFPFISRLWWGSEDIVMEKLEEHNTRLTPFGDGSAVAMVTLFLLLVVSVRFGYTKVPRYHIVISSILVILTTIILASRNQMLAAFIIAGVGIMGKKFLSLKTLVISTVSGATIAGGLYISGNYLRQQSSVIDRAYQRIEETELFNTSDENKSETVLRPILRWERFFNRFVESPIIGSGLSLLPYEPFERLNFHNDIFFILVSSGILGGTLYLLWIFRIYRDLGLLILLPFALPGLTNSFITAAGVVIVYCFIVGVLIERKYCIQMNASKRASFIYSAHC